jgi:hypothetical protein
MQAPAPVRGRARKAMRGEACLAATDLVFAQEAIIDTGRFALLPG